MDIIGTLLVDERENKVTLSTNLDYALVTQVSTLVDDVEIINEVDADRRRI